MASHIEMQRIAHDPVAVRALATRLLQLRDHDWSDWELDFLEGMATHKGPDPLSIRQREKLIELRDDAEFVSTWWGFSVARLINQCWLARYDLPDDDDVQFIEKLKAMRVGSVKRRQIGRLCRCCRELGVLETAA